MRDENLDYSGLEFTIYGIIALGSAITLTFSC
jgi:hypothetical protein